MYLKRKVSLWVFLLLVLSVLTVSTSLSLAQDTDTVTNEVYQDTGTVTDAVYQDTSTVTTEVYYDTTLDEEIWFAAQTITEIAKTIVPAEGGFLEIPGIAKLNIPPNALPAQGPVFTRLVTIKKPTGLVLDVETLSPVVWVRFRGLNTPQLNEPVLLSIQPNSQLEGEIIVRVMDSFPEAVNGTADPIVENGEVVIPLQSPGRVLLTKPLLSQ